MVSNEIRVINARIVKSCCNLNSTSLSFLCSTLYELWSQSFKAISMYAIAKIPSNLFISYVSASASSLDAIVRLFMMKED